MSVPTIDTDLVARVRQALAEAEAEGRQRPGRPALAKLTGAGEHRVRQALDVIDSEAASAAGNSPEVDQLAMLCETPGDDFASPPPAGETSSPAPASVSPGDHHELLLADPHRQLAPAGETPGANWRTAGENLAPAPPAPAIAAVSSGGRVVAWAGFVFGSVVSIAGNVLAARIPPKDAPADWVPSVPAQVGAAVWPLMLLLAVEVLSRVRWPSDGLWKIAGYGGVTAVGAGSALISYAHIQDVLVSWGYNQLGSAVGPLVVDGLMVVSGFALLAVAGGRAGEAGASESPAGEEK